MSTSPFFYKAFLGTNGRPAASGWLFAYAAGSAVLKPIYTDRALTVQAANPLRLDGNGIAPQFFTESGLYDFKAFEYNFVTPAIPGPSCFTAEDIGDLSVGTRDGKIVCLRIGGSETKSVVPISSYGMETLAQIDLPAGFFLTHSRLSLVALVATQDDPVPVGDLQFIGYLGVVGSEVSVFGSSATGTNSVGTAPIKCDLFAESALGKITSQVTATQDGEADNSNSSQSQPFDFSQPLRFSLRAMHLSAASISLAVYPHSFTTLEATGPLISVSPPDLIFQPLEDQRLSTSNSVAFVGVSVRNLVSNATERSTTSVDPSLTMMTEHSGTGTDTETLPAAIGSRELRIYQNDGTKAWTLLCAGADVVRVPDPLATATSTLVYPGNTRWMYDSAPGIWKVISPGPFLPLFAGELNPVTGQCWFGSPASSGGIVIRTNTSGTGTANIDYYGGVDGKRRLTLRWSDLADAYAIQTSNDDGTARLDRLKIPRASERNLIFAGGVGHNVTTRIGTSVTATLAGITRYTGAGGHTEQLDAATVVGEVREYRNSGTGPWALNRAGSDVIDAGNPSATVTSITLLPGQSVRMYVAVAGRWEVL